MAWVSLIIAGIFEVVWAVELKESTGFTKVIPSIITVIAMMLSFALLAYAMKSLPVGTAYPVWTGIGAIGTVLFGILLFGEPKDLQRLFFIFMIIVGIIGLKVSTR